MPVLDGAQRRSTRTLGDAYPYWWRARDGRVHTNDFFADAMAERADSPRTLDPVAVLSILSLQYVALDRTLVQGVSRLGWMSELDAEGVERYEPAPRHGTRRASAARIARELRTLLEQEVLGYCRGKSRLYLMLSGGMDSRVMAGIVAALQQRGALGIPVTAITWGVEQSRDRQYAEKIAEHYGWEWHWAELDAKRHWAQFELCATQLGAEVDPKHLHRMDWFERAERDAVALAASYGDSVGRAEYSSLHLGVVPRLAPAERYRLLKPAVREAAWSQLVQDIEAIRGRYGVRSELGWRELERQSHYMRRMLCTTMGVIGRWCSVKQLFTQRNILELMWGLDVACRKGDVYTELLRDLDPKLLEFAWARTGQRYDSGAGEDARFTKRHHRYGSWLRGTHADRLGELLFHRKLAELEIFDLAQVEFMYREWRRERTDDDTSLATQLSSLAVLSLAAQHFDITAPVADQAGGSHVWARGFLETRAARAYQVARRVSRPWRV
jgi:asparagine synthase (glutamine-hydrolysing)